MKKYLLVAALASGMIMAGGISTVSADTGPLKLTTAELDGVSAAGRYKRRHYTPPTAYAKAKARADAYGRNTSAKTKTWTIADSNAGYSGSGSASKSTARGVWCGACLAY